MKSSAADAVYVVAGGNHVTLLLDREVTAGLLDVIVVLAQPGGGPPPHRHAFAEWFCVVERARGGRATSAFVVTPTGPRAIVSATSRSSAIS